MNDYFVFILASLYIAKAPHHSDVILPMWTMGKQDHGFYHGFIIRLGTWRGDQIFKDQMDLGHRLNIWIQFYY